MRKYRAKLKEKEKQFADDEKNGKQQKHIMTRKQKEKQRKRWQLAKQRYRYMMLLILQYRNEINEQANVSPRHACPAWHKLDREPAKFSVACVVLGMNTCTKFHEHDRSI